MKPLVLAMIIASTSADLSDAARDAKALELYLQDRSDHEEYCPHASWEQPKIEIYKKELSSQLPEGCKK
tara:strand:+ start:154 stop:360 length:207 start_codon:yes stop_codon:yes gene_type:complete